MTLLSGSSYEFAPRLDDLLHHSMSSGNELLAFPTHVNREAAQQDARPHYSKPLISGNELLGFFPSVTEEAAHESKSRQVADREEGAPNPEAKVSSNQMAFFSSKTTSGKTQPACDEPQPDGLNEGQAPDDDMEGPMLSMVSVVSE
jgi:hypothetical protein